MSRATIHTGGAVFSSSSDAERSAAPESNRPCHLLVLADFSGRDHRANNDADTLSQRKIHEVTRDNFDDVFANMNVTLDLSVADRPIKFFDMDDLHPDFIYERVDLFREFRQLKTKLKNRDHFAAAAAEIQSWSGHTQASENHTEVAQSGTPQNDVLDMLLNSSRAQAESQNSVKDLIQQIVAPYVVPSPDPRQAELIDTVEQAASHLLRKILHSSAFQDIESSWRGLYWLLKQLDLSLIHISEPTRPY